MMFADLLDTALAFLLCPLVFVIPGYAVGLATNVLDFRAKEATLRLAMALMFSVAVGPIVIFLLLKIGWWTVWTAYGLSWVVWATLLAKDQPKFAGLKWPLLVGSAVALLLVLMVVDIGWGDKLYFSVAARDHVRTIALTNEVARGAFPHMNPFFNVGEPVQLFYYYGWMQLTSLVDLLGGGLVGPRGTAFAGTAFAGLALMGTVAVFAESFEGSVWTDRTIKLRILFALLFLLVGGVDILVFLAGAVGFALAGRPVIFTDIEWWNEPVLMWITSVVTAPHHVGGLIAALTGFRLARWGVDQSDKRRWRAFALAGVAFASTVFCSVWIGMAAAIVGFAWLVLNVVRKNGREVSGWVVSGLVAGIVALPYIVYLRASGSVDGAPVRLGVRPFGPMETFFGFAREGVDMLAHLPFLPISYILEFGFFALVGFLYWRWRKSQSQPLSPDERFLRVVLLVGLLFPGFVLAAVRNNDLGFRVPMFAQFVVLLWAADYWVAVREQAIELPKTWLKPVLISLLFVGVASTLANGLVLRFATPAADAGLIAMPGMYGEDRHLGERTKDLRDAYTWIIENTPESAIVQHNPRPGVPRREGGYQFANALYSMRRCVALDDDMGTMYGVLHDEYDPVAAQVARPFNDSHVSVATDVARQFAIDAYVISDRDVVWQDSTSWVWTQTPDFESNRVRVYLDPGERF